MALTKDEAKERAFKLGTVFKPTAPINSLDLFAGRQSQTRDVVDAINQQGQHAVLYGERGVGKTSLANMIFPSIQAPGFDKVAPLVNCITSDSYAEIWKRVFSEIQFIADAHEIELDDASKDLLESFTGTYADAIDPDDVRRLLYQLGQTMLVVTIIDEFDTVRDHASRAMMSDTLKFLSDRSVPATVVLIGVADDVETLIENHRSIERCLMQIRMPRMSRDELEEIVSHGLSKVEMTIENAALHEISRLSKGLPHYAHLLGLHAGRSALDGLKLKVTEGNVNDAVKEAIHKAQASIQSDYTKATTSARRDALFRQILLACALAKADDLGYFYPRDVRTPLEMILGRQYKVESFARHLHSFCESKRGPVLMRDEKTGHPRYRFENPLLQPYVIIRGLAERLISEDHLKQTRDTGDPQGRLF